MNIQELPDHLIFLTLHGSRAYGTARPTSDYDVRGVAIAPLKNYFSRHRWEQFQRTSPYLENLLIAHTPEYEEYARSEGAHQLDVVIFNVTKFFHLASQSNPNILDILFADRRDWIFAHLIWEKIYEQRHKFLSMRVQHAYIGYAMSQLKRIKLHRQWLLSPPKKKPSRKDFGLPEHRSLVAKDLRDLAESFLKKKQEEWQLDELLARLSEDEQQEMRERLLSYFEMVHGRPYDTRGEHEREQAAIQSGISEELYRRLQAEYRYRRALNDWKSYERWLKERHPERAKLEREFGYDTKHASHLVRLLLSAEEILETGNLSVKHPQATLLRQVRDGLWDYERLIDWAQKQEMTIKQLAAKRPLPKTPDQEWVDSFLSELILEFHGVELPKKSNNDARKSKES